MIEISELHHSYGKRAVLRGVNLSFRPGAVTAILGPNACGKTTLIKSILGLVVPSRGSVSIQGQLTDRAGRYREKIGYMPQYPEFPENLAFVELIRMLEDLRQRNAPLKGALIEHFGLKGILKQPFGELSGGTKQKVAAVIAFMFDPAILILDEPTAGLDPLSAVRMRALVESAREDGKTVLYISHVVSEIERLADQVVYLLEGKVSFSGPVSALRLETGELRLEMALVRVSAAGGVMV